MNRSHVLAACLALVSLPGCTLVGAASPAAAAAPDAGLVVSGEGEARAKPDVAVVRLGVEVHRPSMEEARAAMAESQASIVASVKRFGVAPADVQTDQLSLQPEYTFDKDGGRTLRGYVATNVVRVTVRKVEDAGKIVDASVAAAKNDARVDGISFELSDSAALRAEARRLAVADARKRAEQLAADLGVELGEPIAIEEISAAAPGPVLYRAEMMKQSADTPVEPGSVEGRVTVRVRWSIEG